MQSSFQGKTCAVLGLARSGIPAAAFLAARDARVLGYDHKTREQLSPQIAELEDIGVELILGPHQFEGIEKASLIILSPGLKIRHQPLQGLLEKWRENGAEIIGEMELAARFCPAPLIAVTSTKGKSTTVKLITEILNICNVHAVPCGNTGFPLITALPQLTPSSWAVLEASSFQLETTSTLKPRVAVLLNLLEDHQDYHPSLAQYWQAKMQLFARQGAGDFAVLNSDEKRVMEYAAQIPHGVKVLLTSSNSCENCAVETESDVLGWRCDGEFIPVIPLREIPLAGAHNRANVAAALAAVYAALGEKVLLHSEKVAQVIRNFTALPHRLEVVASNGVTWINDSQATIPDASSAALRAFSGQLLLIAGGRAKLDASAYARWARDVAERAAYLLTIGEAQEMMGEMARSAGMPAEKIIASGDLRTAITDAKRLAQRGACVILSPACSSFDQFNSYEERGDKFREWARQSD